LTKIHKVVSDLQVQYFEQCSRTIEIDETETRKLCYMTSRILKESVRKKINSTAPIKLAEFAIPYLFNKKKYEKCRRAYRDKNQHMENSLDDAVKIIQKTNAKKLFKIINMNMKDGPEKTIDYIIESFEKTESIEINGMTLLVGEVRKVP